MLVPRRQMTIFALHIPQCRSLGQQQLGPPLGGLPLLSLEPFAQRRNEVVVSELILGRAPVLVTSRFGCRDQP